MRLLHTGGTASTELLVQTLRNDGLDVEREEPPDGDPGGDPVAGSVLYVADQAAGTVVEMAVASAIAVVKSQFPESHTVIQGAHDHEEASEPPRGI